MRKALKSSLILLALVLVFPHLSAGSSTGSINFYSSVVQFPNPVYDTAILLEFPFSLNRNEFEFFKSNESDSLWEARIYAQILLVDTLGSTVDSASTYFALNVKSKQEAELADIRVFNKLQIYAQPGRYSADVNIVDVSSKKSGRYRFAPFDVAPIERSRLSIGGMQLAHSIRYVGEDKGSNYRMVKNGYLIYPSPIGVFGTADTSMMIYAEVYNMQYDSVNPGSFNSVYNVLNEDSSFFVSFGMRDKSKAGESGIVAESFDIRGWPARLYLLQLIVSDLQTKQADTAVVPFGILKPITPDEVTMLRNKLDDPYDKMALDEQLHLVEYLLAPHQAQTLDALTSEGKKNFLAQFWKEADEDQTTPIIENRIEMIRRYRYANDRFSTNTLRDNGWYSNRGRIYMIYGDPVEIDDVQTPRVGNPYQIWYYRYLLEGKYFIFEDYTGNNDYRLVHSNVDGEIFNQDWQDFVDRGTQIETE